MRGLGREAGKGDNCCGEVVVDDEALCELGDGDQVAHAGACEEDDMGSFNLLLHGVHN